MQQCLEQEQDFSRRGKPAGVQWKHQVIMAWLLTTVVLGGGCALLLRLRDPCRSVRQTAALVMTHLILKDMVKVKGQVSEMAALLIDPEEDIVGLARNFFTELSGKVRRKGMVQNLWSAKHQSCSLYCAFKMLYEAGQQSIVAI